MVINANNTGTLAIVASSDVIFGIFADATDAARLARSMERRRGHRSNITCRRMSAPAVMDRVYADLPKYYGMERELIKTWIRDGQTDLSQVRIGDKRLRIQKLADWRAVV